MKRVAVPFLLACATAWAQANDPSPVRTTSGLVQGLHERDAVVYKGIPFAQPPVADLRWRAPRSAPQWVGVLTAREYKPQCMQVGPPLPTMPVEPVSEDCLYLNLWGPATPAKARLPVMVYLHGGAFRLGSPSTPLYCGHRLATTHQVITVNLAYRVGPLGFLVHPELSAESEHSVSGNYGLLDMVAGLRWVRENIAAFGGDPDNVTLVGHSAGAWAVNKLMISPLAHGLFHKAIDELRKLPAKTIASAKFDGLPEIAHSNAALPIMDGYVIPDDTYTLYATGKQARVPLLIGYNRNEGSYLVRPIETPAYVAATRKTYGALADQFLALYPAASEAESARSQTRLWAESAFGWSARQRELGATISGYWTHFAKTGDPNGTDLPRWPAYDLEKDEVMYLGERLAPGPMPDRAEHALMERYMSDLRTSRR